MRNRFAPARSRRREEAPTFSESVPKIRTASRRRTSGLFSRTTATRRSRGSHLVAAEVAPSPGVVAQPDDGSPSSPPSRRSAARPFRASSRDPRRRRRGPIEATEASLRRTQRGDGAAARGGERPAGIRTEEDGDEEDEGPGRREGEGGGGGGNDEEVQAIACYDIDKFVRHYPNGRAIARSLGAKDIVMKLVDHQNKELTAASKMLLQNWAVS
ncbi:hypothetical protein ACHAWF_009290 [Thalassiosira exigua]